MMQNLQTFLRAWHLLPWPAAWKNTFQCFVYCFFFFSDEEGSLYYFTFPGEITTGRVSVNSIVQQHIKQKNAIVSEIFWIKRGDLTVGLSLIRGRIFFSLIKCTGSSRGFRREKIFLKNLLRHLLASDHISSWTNASRLFRNTLYQLQNPINYLPYFQKWKSFGQHFELWNIEGKWKSKGKSGVL